jgi:hypothetical protein
MAVKTAGVGHFQIPSAPAAGTSVTSGAANALTGTAIVLSASTSGAMYITGVHAEAAAASAATYKLVQLCIGGSGSETSIGQYLVPMSTGSTVALGFRPIYPPIPVANASRLSVKTADSVGSQATLITVECLLATNYVDDAVAVTTVTSVTNQLTAAQIATGVWQDATSGDFTVSSSIGKSLYTTGNAPGAASGIALVGSNMGTITGALTAAQIATGVWQDTTAGDFTTALSVGKSVMNGVALGTGLTVNTVTNQLTAAAIATGVWTDTTAGDFTTALSVGKSVMNGVSLGTGLTVATATNLTNLPSIPANWLTAAGINASALNGKGDWNIGKTGYALSSAGVQAIWDALTSVLTTVGSIGKLLVDNVNATISSRLASASYTAPLDAAGTRTAVGLASANLDTQIAALPTTSTVMSADIKKVNGTTVTGNGSAATPWGP